MSDKINENIEKLDENTVNETAGANDLNYITSWYTLNNEDYFLAYTTIPNLPSGLYKIIYNEDYGMGVTEIKYDIDDIFFLSGTPYTNIINDFKPLIVELLSDKYFAICVISIGLAGFALFIVYRIAMTAINRKP